MLAIMYQFQGVAQQTDHGDRVDQVAGELAKAQNLLDAKNAELEEIKRQVAGELAKAQNLLDAKHT